MLVNIEAMVSMTEANQNFSKVAKLVDKNGAAVILKNNAPRYIVLDYSQIEQSGNVSDDDLLTASKKFIEINKKTYEGLANN